VRWTIIQTGAQVPVVNSPNNLIAVSHKVRQAGVSTANFVCDADCVAK
jgi:hypothetical protein